MPMSIIERERETVEVAPGVTKRDLFIRAADLLEEFGWTQLSKGMPMCHMGERRPLCYLGAIVQAAYDFGIEIGEYPDEFVFAGSFIEESFYAAYDWNDAEERTGREVVAKLRAEAFRA